MFVLSINPGKISIIAAQCYFDLLTAMYCRFTHSGLVAPRITRAKSGAAIGVGMLLIPQIMGPQGQAQAPTAPLIICPKCHAYVPAVSKFCPECGTSLKPPVSATIICPKCGYWIPSSSKFCPQCGIQLSQKSP